MQLSDGPARVVDLAMAHDITRPAISRHLKCLLSADLVTAHDRGRERHYALVSDSLQEVTRFVQEVTSPAAPPVSAQALDALETELRRTRRAGRVTRASEPTDTNEESA